METFSFWPFKSLGCWPAIKFHENFLAEAKFLGKEIKYTKKSLVSATLFDREVHKATV